MKKEVLKFETGSIKQYKYKFDGINNPYLVKLRSQNKLDLAVGAAKDDLEVVKRLCYWTSDKLQHNGRGFASKNEPLVILKEAEQGKGFRCVEHATLLQGCLSSFGFKSRSLSLMRKEIEKVERAGGHVVVEVYLDSIKRWVMLDPDERVVPLFKEGSPMNAVELQNAITRDTDIRISNHYRNFVYPYLFYFCHRLNNGVMVDKSRAKNLILVPKSYKVPKIFEAKWPIRNSVWTHSVSTFYQKP
jgi:hypothetical protein